MQGLIEVLGPAFVASFALQQLIELLDPILDVIIRAHKKWILSLVSLSVGLILAIVLDLGIMRALDVTIPVWLDILVTALFLTGSTKGINDLLKLIGYKKQSLKSSVRPEAAANV
jgi:hypothetical protein